MEMQNKKKDFLTLKDYTEEEIRQIIAVAAKIKKDRKLYSSLLAGKSIGMLFDKHSTRTRLSFEAGISQMGGNCIYLDAATLQISRGETLEDSARVFGRYLDGLVIRTFAQKTVEVFAEFSGIPVINGLTDMFHPCQVLSDIFTIQEIGLLNKGLKFTYVGDCNNVCNSLIIGFTKLGIDITIGCSPEYGPLPEIIKYAAGEADVSGDISGSGSSSSQNGGGGRIKLIYDPAEAVLGADIIYTDVWVSMGDTHSEEKIRELSKFQVNSKLLSLAKKDVRVMHCLPAHREQEITSEVYPPLIQTSV